MDSKAVAELCQELNILIRSSPPYRHQSQAYIEIVWRSLLAMVRVLLCTASLSDYLWPYAANHAVYIRNRTPHRALSGKSPLHYLSGTPASISDLRIFGCPAYAFTPMEVRTSPYKLHDHSRLLTYVGNSATSSSFLLIDATSPNPYIINSGMVRFDEKAVLRNVHPYREPRDVRPLETLSFDMGLSDSPVILSTTSDEILELAGYHLDT